MKILWKTNLVVVTLLSVAAALPKIMQMPQEVEFFQNAGLGQSAVVVFGLVQLAGGALLVLQRTRTTGAAIAAAAFLASALMLFAAGQNAFGLVSVLPAVMAGMLTRKSP